MIEAQSALNRRPDVANTRLQASSMVPDCSAGRSLKPAAPKDAEQGEGLSDAC